MANMGMAKQHKNTIIHDETILFSSKPYRALQSVHGYIGLRACVVCMCSPKQQFNHDGASDMTIGSGKCGSGFMQFSSALRYVVS